MALEGGALKDEGAKKIGAPMNSAPLPNRLLK